MPKQINFIICVAVTTEDMYFVLDGVCICLWKGRPHSESLHGQPWEPLVI